MDLNYPAIATCVFNSVTGVADGSERPKYAAELLLAVLEKSLQFEADPVCYHLSEIAKRIIHESTLAPAYLESFPQIQIDYSVSDCTRPPWPIRHTHTRLRKDILSPIMYFGTDEAIQNAAKQIDSHCPVTWEAPSMPFVDDAPCHCKNCSIKI